LKKALKEIRRKEEMKNNNDLNGTFDNGGNQFNIVENDNNITFIEKSNINLDLTKKLATYMDFSVVLNRKDDSNLNDLSVIRNNDNIFSIMHNHQERNLWDVSCIEKN
jgi:hypothetical protein